MSYIAHLDLAINASLTGARWQEIARESGTPLRAYDGPPGPNNIEPFIREALGLVLPYENFLLEESLRACISETVTNGKRLLVYLDPNSLTALNPFLAAYDIAGTDIAAYVLRPELAHPGLTTIKRSKSPESFRTHLLLDGVNELVLGQPSAIRYGGLATPIITLSLENRELVERFTDFPAEWTSPEISSIVLSETENGGGVLALSCSFLHDAFRVFPGIDGADNAVLAKNIIKWLAGASSVTPPAVQAFEILDHIERSLVSYVQQKLALQFSDWWTKGVPINVRKKCVERREEGNNKLPKAAYIDLLDVKIICEENWPLFEKEFGGVGWKGGKKNALGWFNRLNDVRRIVMHPTRRHFAPSLPNAEDMSFLSDIGERVRSLLAQRSKSVL